MSKAAIMPEAGHFLWLLVFALFFVAMAMRLPHFRSQGYPWWARFLLILLFLCAGHLVQALIPWRGLPGVLELLLFPLVPATLTQDYYWHFTRNDDWGRNDSWTRTEAWELSQQWGYGHAAMIWVIVASIVFFWIKTGRPKVFLYGDEEALPVKNKEREKVQPRSYSSPPPLHVNPTTLPVAPPVSSTPQILSSQPHLPLEMPSSPPVESHPVLSPAPEFSVDLGYSAAPQFVQMPPSPVESTPPSRADADSFQRVDH